MSVSRTTFRGTARQAFDSARLRVIERREQPGAAGHLVTRLFAKILKVPGFALLAGLSALALQSVGRRRSLVRAWRSCGYLDQIARSLCGKV